MKTLDLIFLDQISSHHKSFWCKTLLNRQPNYMSSAYYSHIIKTLDITFQKPEDNFQSLSKAYHKSLEAFQIPFRNLLDTIHSSDTLHTGYKLVSVQKYLLPIQVRGYHMRWDMCPFPPIIGTF